jgi:hypothetical protein
MMPFIPPPPNCTDLPFQAGAKATWKLIVLALGDLSRGAIAPFTLQYAGVFFAAGFQRGALKVTADTGSPMADMGMLSPSFAAVQSVSVAVIDPAGA